MSPPPSPLGSWRTSAPLFAFLVLIAVLAWLVFRYFLLTFAVAGSLALLLAPVHGALARRFGGRGGLAAAVLVLVTVLVVLAPVITYGTLVMQQAVAFFEWLRPQLEPHAFERLWTITLPERFPTLAAWIQQTTGDTPGHTASVILSRAAGEANRAARAALGGLATVLFEAALFVMMLFFLLRDGDQLREAVRGISPLTRAQETEAIDHLTRTVKGVLQSMLLVPLIQGALGILGFWLFGVPAALLWGVSVIFAAMIPILGSPLAWIPAVLYLLSQGRLWGAVGMAAYGTLVISGIDNVLKPVILRETARIHTMLGFLSIIGGVLAFGPRGLIVGPVVLSLVLSAYRIYRYDILRWRDERPS
jgi:predicted PurR-regulated permease PerM